MIDYTGNLNSHEQYIKTLKALESKTKYIEIVLIDEKETNELVDKFKKDIILEKKVSEWWGTITAAKNKLIRIEASKEFFQYLETFETFCKYHVSRSRGDHSSETNFGDDDIVFYDENNSMLLYTTTHEGYITIKEDLFK